MRNTPLISVIVPIYNVELYIKECIESVLSQSYQNWELLLIDDGSTDSSYSICERFSCQDNRIKAIHKENEGVCRTRNRGIELAQGDYIIFLDADDYWCDSDCLRILVETAEKNNLDIVRGEYKAITSEGKDLFCRSIEDKRFYYYRVFSSVDFLKNIVKSESFLWLFLIKRSYLGAVRFNEHKIFLEDMELLSTLLSRPSRTMGVPLRFYAYRKLENSVSAQRNKKKLEDSFSMCYFFLDCGDRISDKRLARYFHRNGVMMYYWTLDTLTEPAYYSDRILLIKELSLKPLQRFVGKNLFRYKVFNTSMLVNLLPPQLGIAILYNKHKLGAFLRSIKLLTQVSQVIFPPSKLPPTCRRLTSLL